MLLCTNILFTRKPDHKFFYSVDWISVTGLEPEFQPVVNHLLPNIMSHKQDAHDMYLQWLQDMTNRLLVFLPHRESWPVFQMLLIPIYVFWRCLLVHFIQYLT